MGVSPAADAEESVDFCFSMAYDSALPLSPSSPTPLPSFSWQATAPGSAHPSSDALDFRPMPQVQNASHSTKQGAPLQGQIHCVAGQSGRSQSEAEPDQPDLPPTAVSRGDDVGASTSKEPSSEAEPLSQKLDQRATTATSVPESNASSSGQSSIRLEGASQVAGGSPQESGAKPAAAMKAPTQRKKVPYEKGFSQMDWLKLTRTHADLAGLKGGPRRRIKMEEVQLHKSEDDSWTVLRGKVFNITPYFNFHPGGKKMLRLAAGKDCTELFNKYHMWVNAEFLLEKCWLGILDSD